MSAIGGSESFEKSLTKPLFFLPCFFLNHLWVLQEFLLRFPFERVCVLAFTLGGRCPFAKRRSRLVGLVLTPGLRWKEHVLIETVTSFAMTHTLLSLVFFSCHNLIEELLSPESHWCRWLRILNVAPFRFLAHISGLSCLQSGICHSHPFTRHPLRGMRVVLL